MPLSKEITAKINRLFAENFPIIRKKSLSLLNLSKLINAVCYQKKVICCWHELILEVINSKFSDYTSILLIKFAISLFSAIMPT